MTVEQVTPPVVSSGPLFPTEVCYYLYWDKEFIYCSIFCEERSSNVLRHIDDRNG